MDTRLQQRAAPLIHGIVHPDACNDDRLVDVTGRNGLDLACAENMTPPTPEQ